MGIRLTQATWSILLDTGSRVDATTAMPSMKIGAPTIRGITHTARPLALSSWEGSVREWARVVGDSCAGFVHLQVAFGGLRVTKHTGELSF